MNALNLQTGLWQAFCQRTFRHSMRHREAKHFQFYFTFAIVVLTAMSLHAAPVTGNLQLWLDASDETTILDDDGENALNGNFDGDVQTWSDKSGNNRHATANPQKPQYVQSDGTLNNQGVVDFNFNGGTSEAFNLASSINTTAETMFFVTKMATNGNNEGAFVGNTSGTGFLNDNNRYFLHTNVFNEFLNNTAPTAAYQIVTETRRSSDSFFTVYEDGTSVVPKDRTGTLTVDAVGKFLLTPRYLRANVGEILIYDRTLNTAERVITEDYLQAKYNTATLGVDRYAGDTAGNGDHDFNVFGIGNDAASTISPAGELNTSSGDAISLAELNNSLAVGDYLLAGHGSALHGTTTADLPAGISSRWNRDYYLDVTGTLDARLTFDLNAQALAGPDGYKLLYRSTPTGMFVDTGLLGTLSLSNLSFDLSGFTTSNDGFYTIGTIAQVPEPNGIILGIVGAIGLWRAGRRRKPCR
jgi:hypothetical protein